MSPPEATDVVVTRSLSDRMYYLPISLARRRACVFSCFVKRDVLVGMQCLTFDLPAALAGVLPYGLFMLMAGLADLFCTGGIVFLYLFDSTSTIK